MTQIADPFIATVTPADIGDGLAAGDYVAQVRVSPVATAVSALYATADAPPTDLSAWFEAGGGDAFLFSAGPDCPPTWVRISAETAAFVPGSTLPVAIARLVSA